MTGRVILLDPEPRCECGRSFIVTPAGALGCRNGHLMPGSAGIGHLWLGFLIALDSSFAEQGDDLDPDGGPRHAA